MEELRIQINQQNESEVFSNMKKQGYYLVEKKEFSNAQNEYIGVFRKQENRLQLNG